MKVVIIGPVWPYRGGISHHTAVLSDMLSQSGFEVKVISFRRQYPVWLYPGQTDKDNSQEPLRFDAKFILDPFDIVSWWKTVQEIRRDSPDIVAIQWWTTFWSIPLGIITRYLRKMNIKTIFLIHNVLPHEKYFWDKILVRFALTASNNYLAHSEMEKQKLLTLNPECSINVLPLPAFTMPATELILKEDARRKLNIPVDCNLLLFFGFVRPYKGLKLLLDSMGFLKHAGIKPHLLIAGEFWHDKDSYLAQINKLDIPDQVHIIDQYIPNEKVSVIFSAADVLIAPYLEGATQSAVVKLAYGYGIPLIVSELIADKFSLVENYDQMIFPTGDTFGLAQGIRNFLELPHARAAVQSKFDNDKIINFFSTLCW